ncbi:four-helix bundle copper-binding protein [Pseudomonas corrugata]|uniref:Four-helix bundle copper-binding protein n=1 Tax=Pseudomonas corrugata TaxID=47879 RepID=A0A8B6UIQ1_9PSED|nr:four-helix bundle copper-binding protein [Pseudomonas corrugata]MDU9032224.1 four-helix bundle copper-binding protein [Pseudomonas corrugata]MDU9037755.1 four-helix bundle copper-binding protein [Pseudomonas corrugata]MDU9038950.1 four-helix bundle copper-binding protein [Pseudomonas corrugata]QTH11778.1 four-helix bundle copper-binding protein [Pseudomonas corrugata]UZD92898.1 four-helix bundle copper-binding protein [Pseudomonas corrugata]
MTKTYEDCVSECLRCALACETCASSCLQEQNVQMMANCIKLDRDCADMCVLAARLMARNSDLATGICRLCAQACRACANECGKHEAEHCQKCAQACRTCAEACEAMAA